MDVSKIISQLKRKFPDEPLVDDLQAAVEPAAEGDAEGQIPEPDDEPAEPTQDVSGSMGEPDEEMSDDEMSDAAMNEFDSRYTKAVAAKARKAKQPR